MTTSPLASRSATRALLDAYGLSANKRLGQNFLVDNRVVERTMELAAIKPDDRALEVGPGIGTLTLALLQEAAHVTSIEADQNLEPVLHAYALQYEDFSYLMGDALKVSVEEIGQASGGLPDIMVSNLPYNVAATVTLTYLQKLASLRAVVVMVQKEVADRIAARPGGKEYGAYTVKLALYGTVTGRFEVGPSSFMPAPHVDSAVVRIDRAERELPVPAALVARTVDAAFAQRRKTIRNSMAAAGFEKDALDAAYAAAGVAPTARAETLPPETFIQLAQELERLDAFAGAEGDASRG